MGTIAHSTMETDLRLAAALDQEVRILLTDMHAMRTVPGAIVDCGSVNGTGSDTKRVRFAGLDGYDAMTAAGEADVSNTSLTDASADIAVARIALRYDLLDLAAFTGVGPNDINIDRLAGSMAGAAEQGFNILLANVIDDWTTDAVDSSNAMTADDFYDGTYQLELNSVPGPWFSALHPRQHTHLRNSLRSEVGPAQYMEATQEQLTLKGQGFQGNFLNVGIYNMSDIITTSSKKQGAIWGQGALGYAYGNPTVPMGAGSEVRRIPGNQSVFVEIERDASGGLSEIVGNSYIGVAIIEQARGYGLNTSST
jgi:hypothetical protein